MINKTKVIQCEDCGEWIEVNIKATKTKRCANCQKEYIRKYDRERKNNEKNRNKKYYLSKKEQ